MDLSVVIVSYNVASYLDQALATLREALLGIDAEVFVVDNASADGSVAMVRERYPSVTLIANDVNAGFARANNQALARARGDFVLLLNPDTVLRRDTLSTMLAFFRSHPDAGAAGCRVLNPDGSLQLACRRGFPTPAAAFFKMAGLADLFPRSRIFGAYNMTWLDPDRVAEVDAVSGSFLMVRRAVLGETGLLDEDFFMYGEDLDFCWRVKKTGWKIYYVPGTEIIHFKGESAKTVPSLKSTRDFYEAMHIFARKHHTGWTYPMPRWLVAAGIYLKMGAGIAVGIIRRSWQPALDLLLLNVSLILSIILRFGLGLDTAPGYSDPQWVSVFVVYSALYMTTFYFAGIYHRHRYRADRAILAIFIGFVLNVFIVNFIKQYNFSRIASFYCWGFNTLFISGWRFVAEMMAVRVRAGAGKTALVVGSLDDAVALRECLGRTGTSAYDIIGCIGIGANTIRGAEKAGIHVLALVDELAETVRAYDVDTVLMIGSTVPFSKILSTGGRAGWRNPEFKFIPELNAVERVESGGGCAVPMIDIHAGRMPGTPGRW